MKYLSLFSGIGGLESPSTLPVLLCELSPSCRKVLETRFPGVVVWDDVCTLRPPNADVLVGGFPCQDISIAGKQNGFAGSRSNLFYEMLRVAKEAGTSTLVAENVPNLIELNGGAVMRAVVESLEEAGFPFIAWRMLNAREFGLPQHRNRIFLIASKHSAVAKSIHRPLSYESEPGVVASADGFYWTAGIQSICYSRGFTPTLKVGSSLSIPSPPAVFFDKIVRKLTATECLLLQGFKPEEFASVTDKDVLLMTGNAVPVPAGHFVMAGVEGSYCEERIDSDCLLGWSRYPRSGMILNGKLSEVRHHRTKLAENLGTVIDRTNRAPLSERAAAGLLARLTRSMKDCPSDLNYALRSAAGSLSNQSVSAEPIEVEEVHRHS